MRAWEALVIILVILVTASGTGCTTLARNRTVTAAPTPTPAFGYVSGTPAPTATTIAWTPQPTPTSTPKPYFGKYHPGEVVSGNVNNTDGMIVIEKSLNGSYYRMNSIYMEDATSGIYTTKYNPQWYSAQSVDGSYPAVIGHVNPGYIPVSEAPTTRKP